MVFVCMLLQYDVGRLHPAFLWPLFCDGIPVKTLNGTATYLALLGCICTGNGF